MSSSKKQSFEPVDQNVSIPLVEEATINYWKENKTFEKSIEFRPESKTWTFLDGPPFITGLPHYGSLLSSIPKDVFPRYWTMKGYRVRRVWGWDCHGLPAENKVENKLGITRKKDIEEKIGVKKFIDECKLYVKDTSSEWEWYIDHVGRWADFKNAYRTMDTDYMESVMWVFKSMYEKDFIYKGLRVSLYCPHCSTPISNFEVAMDSDNYKEITEKAQTYKYKLVGAENTYFLAWSTTPWNKIATPALAVNPNLTYVKVKEGNETLILAETTMKMLKSDTPHEVVEKVKGSELVGLSFEPHYDFAEHEEGKKRFVVIPGDFVTADEGTGIVTIAAYGEEDMEVMKKENIQIILHVDEEGHILKDVPKFGGMFYLKANGLVVEDLTSRGLIYKEEPYTHTIPTCWRCHERLIYAPQNAWYVDIQRLKPLLRKTNESINWYPDHFKLGRFLKSVESAPDWCISRSRYWGSPVPVWECSECDARVVIGSISELEELSGVKIEDLHKPEIDDVTIKCKECSHTMHRVPEVLDSWIEAGSASFAERHFPFNKNVKLEDFFPPDYIIEYTGQIRAWFYVLHVIGAALYEAPAFKNVSVTGVVLGTDGRKMSKNFGNYPDPKEMLSKYGGDALRLYLMGSPVMNGEDIIISEDEYKNQVRGVLLTVWNIYNFFVTYAISDGWEKGHETILSKNPLDMWGLSRLSHLNKDVSSALEAFDSVSAVNAIKAYVDDLSTWYIRRSRNRVGPKAKDIDDRNNFYETTFRLLTEFCQIAAPVIPFITEEIYRNLTKSESVHLTDWPKFESDLINPQLEEDMTSLRALASVIHMKRKQANVPVRTPILVFKYVGPNELPGELLSILSEEVNVEKVRYEGKAKSFEGVQDESYLFEASNLDEKRGEVRALVRKIQEERKMLKTKLDQKVDVTLPTWPVEYENDLKEDALIRNLSKGEFSVVPVNE